MWRGLAGEYAVKLEGVRWFAVPSGIFELCDDAHQIAVLTYLFMRAGPRGGSWPSYQSIAAACHIGRSTVIKTIGELKRRGLVKVEPRTRPDGARTSNGYVLVISSAYQQGLAIGASPPDERGGVRQTDGVRPLHSPELYSVELSPIELNKHSVSDVQSDVAPSDPAVAREYLSKIREMLNGPARKMETPS